MFTRLKLIYANDPDILYAFSGSTIGTIVAATLHFLDVYVFNDLQFLTFLLIMIALDAYAGARKAKREKTFSGKLLFNKTKDKLINYTIILIVVHVLVHFKVRGEEVDAMSWVDVTIYTALMGYEAGSIIKKLGGDIKKIIPSELIDKLTKDNKDNKDK